MKTKIENNELITVWLPERIDSSNADEVEAKLYEISELNPGKSLSLNAENMEYISSAGLRLLLKFQKAGLLENLGNVSQNVYSILDNTGFIGIINVNRLAASYEYDHNALIGCDSFGKLYKADKENVIRVYDSHVDPSDIEMGFECAKVMMNSPVSCAIPFDMVTTSNGKGCLYSVEDFMSVSTLITKQSDADEFRVKAINKIVKQLNLVHGVTELSDCVPRETDRLPELIYKNLNAFSEEEKEKICHIVRKISRGNKVILENVNERTILISYKEPVLVDFSLLRFGNPLFEIAGFYRNVYEFSSLLEVTDKAEIEHTWQMFLSKYLGTDDKGTIENYDYAAKCFAALMSSASGALSEKEGVFSTVAALVRDYFIKDSSKLEECLEKIKTLQDAENKNSAEALNIDIKQRTVLRGFKKAPLLKDIKMTLYPGEMVLLLGGSGAGKTTFLNAVTGYEKADAVITKGEYDLYKDYERIKHKIAFAPQQDLLRNEDSVYNTLKNAAEMRLPVETTKEDINKEIDRMLDIFGLALQKDSHIGVLSGGQRKRASIATEFIADPDLFFLDEPDSGLDGVMARSLMEDLRKITGDSKIIVVISHAPDRVIDLFDKVIILAKSEVDNAGHLAFYGTPAEARKFFECERMEEILKHVNRTNEGGDGRADEFINKYAQWR